MADKPSKLSTWKIAIRPHTLPAAIAPILVAGGIAAQEEQFLLLPAAAALFCALMLQITSNLVNDIMDYKKGADTGDRVGFTRVSQTGLLSEKEVWGGVITIILVTSLVGGYLVWLRGVWVLIIGILSILASILYTAGPYPLAYHGFGELFVFLFFGLVNLCGSVFVITGEIPPISWIMAVNLGALITAILVVNNIRDVEDDRRVGRRNIPVVLGIAAAFLEYRILLIFPYLLLLVTAVITSQYFLLLPFVTLPYALKLIREISQLTGTALNSVLKRTTQLVLYYGVFLTIGFLLS